MRHLKIAAWILACSVAAGTLVGQTSKPAAKTGADYGFRSSEHVKAEVTEKVIVVHSDGIPDHTTGDFPNRNNPNRITRQNYTFSIPLTYSHSATSGSAGWLFCVLFCPA